MVARVRTAYFAPFLSQHDPSLVIQWQQEEETMRTRPICCQPYIHEEAGKLGYIFSFRLFFILFLYLYSAGWLSLALM